MCPPLRLKTIPHTSRSWPLSESLPTIPSNTCNLFFTHSTLSSIDRTKQEPRPWDDVICVNSDTPSSPCARISFSLGISAHMRSPLPWSLSLIVSRACMISTEWWRLTAMMWCQTSGIIRMVIAAEEAFGLPVSETWADAGARVRASCAE